MIKAWASPCKRGKRGDELLQFRQSGRADFVARRAIERQFDRAIDQLPRKRLALESFS